MDRRPLIVGLLAVSLVLAGWWTWRAEPTPPPLTTSSVTTSVPARITVHVAGAVGAPGVVVVPDGSRVVDAIAAAGGLIAGARTDVVNLAAPVRDGDHIVIPDRTVEAGAVASDGTVRLNVAVAADLESLPGVGPVLAERIIQYRDRNGPFGEVEDLLDVPGIGEAKLSSMRDLIIVP